MSLIDHAKRELDIIGLREDSDDEMNVAMRNHLLQLVEEFSAEGHSGFSANYALSILNKVLAFKPLTELTGEDSEWEEVADDLYQNKRAPDVFKNANGAYWTQGIVFWEWFSSPDIDDGKPYKTYFTSRDSRVPVTFPWRMPNEPEYREADPNR